LGNIVANQTIDVRFTIIADTGPTNVYLEMRTGTTYQFVLFGMAEINLNS
jgi:hypothetical protein